MSTLTQQDTPSIEERPTSAALSLIANTLRQCSLFSRLDPETLSDLARSCRLVRLQKGGLLFHEGETAQGFYVVQSGTIALSRISFDGKEQVISLFRPYDCFAEATLTTLETYPANATALEPSQVVLVSKNSFRELISAKPDLAMSMLASMSMHLKHLVQMIEDLKFKQIECRLACWLLQQTKSRDNVIEMTYSKKVLASRLGVTSETLSRAFARFRNEHLITVDSRIITLLNRDGLESYLQVA